MSAMPQVVRRLLSSWRPPEFAQDERAHLRDQLLHLNVGVSRHLTLVTLALVPMLAWIDYRRWHAGLFDASVLYWSLALTHCAFATSVLPGASLWLPNHDLKRPLGAFVSKLHLVTLTGSILAMGVLGIFERGGLVLLGVALFCTNLVYQLPFLQRSAFNFVSLAIGGVTLILVAQADFLRVLIAMSELIGLVLICAVAGELHFRDRVKLIIAELRMSRMALMDALTGLANRRKLQDAIHRELAAVARGRALTLVLADVDHFKAVNDTYGHDIGDEVLKTVANLLSQGARQPDLVGRWGGEEFLVVCPDTERAGGRQLAERLAARLRSHTIPVAGPRTASFGVAQAQVGETMEALFVRVDRALYAAKQGGRDRVCIDEAP